MSSTHRLNYREREEISFFVYCQTITNTAFQCAKSYNHVVFFTLLLLMEFLCSWNISLIKWQCTRTSGFYNIFDSTKSKKFKHHSKITIKKNVLLDSDVFFLLFARLFVYINIYHPVGSFSKLMNMLFTHNLIVAKCRKQCVEEFMLKMQICWAYYFGFWYNNTWKRWSLCNFQFSCENGWSWQMTFTSNYIQSMQSFLFFLTNQKCDCSFIGIQHMLHTKKKTVLTFFSFSICIVGLYMVD